MKLTTGFFIALIIGLFASCGPKADKAAAEDTTAQPQAPDYKYCNAKYGFCIIVPSDSLIVKEGSDTEEGRVYVSANGNEDALLSIHTGNRDASIKGGINELKAAFDKDVSATKDDRTNTVNTFKNTEYIIMGYRGRSTIFYQKTIISKGQIVTAYYEYDDKVKDTYYQLIDAISRTFK